MIASPPDSISNSASDSDVKEIHIDTCGLLCPWPVLRLARMHRHALACGLVRVRFYLRTSDPLAALDVSHYCAQNGLYLRGERELAAPADDSADSVITLFMIDLG